MNIFMLDRDPRVAANMHCDKHVVKMILETAQLLCTAHRVLDGDQWADETGLYKTAFKNHPCAVWVRDCVPNYVWAYQLFSGLLEEYFIRYGKVHSCKKLEEWLYFQPDNMKRFSWELHLDPNQPIRHRAVTTVPQCMPDKYKCDDPVQAYRNYYNGEKLGFAVWKSSEVPSWINV